MWACAGVESEVCAACLGYGAPLTSCAATTHYLRLLLGDAQVLDTLAVCWQCRAAVLSMRRFHDLVRNSQEVLRRFSHGCLVSSKEDPKPVLLNLNNRLAHSSVLTVNTPGEINTASPQKTTSIAVLKPNYDDECKLQYSIAITQNVSTERRQCVFGTLSIVYDSDQSDDEVLSSIRQKKLIKSEKVEACSDMSDRNYSDGCEDTKTVKIKKSKKRKLSTRCTQFKQVIIGNNEILSELNSEEEKETNRIHKKVKASSKTKRRKETVEKPKGRQNDKFKKVVIGEEQMLADREEERRAKWYVQAPFRCESCIIGYYSAQHLSEHRRLKHNQSDGFACAVCATRCGDARQLARHVALHYRRIECRVCGERHRAYRDMWRHHLRQHEPARTFACALCGKSFPTRPTLVYHRRCEHRERCACEHCGRTFRNQTTYKRHLLIHTGMPTYECAVCGRSYRGKFGFRTHMKTHGPPPRDAYCARCDVQYKHAFQYRRHVKISARHAAGGAEPPSLAPDRLNKYPCSDCEKKFVSPSVLRRHHDSVHLKLKRYGCDKCDKNYATPAALWTHRKMQHERVVPPRDKVCEVCGKGFRSNTTLVDHMRSHTGERPYSCDVCAATFRHNSGLYMHKRLVHKMGKKRVADEGAVAAALRTGLPLACGACPATFAHASGRYVHERLAHARPAARADPPAPAPAADTRA